MPGGCYPAAGMKAVTRSDGAAATAAAAVPLSIVVATIQGWPEIERNLRTMEVATRRAGGELIVVDGSGRPAPVEKLGPEVRWISIPGASVFQARAVAYREALGDVVAITEDHCRVPDDWGERMVDAHRRHPEAAAIGGAVENGATSTRIDWASFFIVQIAAMPPLKDASPSRLASAVNVSYKRHALAMLDEHEGMGAMDVLLLQRLRDAGERLVADDAIRVEHDQSLGIGGTTVVHYHAGRTMSGFRRQQMGPRQWIRAGGTFVIPWLRLARIFAVGASKQYRAELLPSLPWIVWLLHAQAAGQFVGYALGPGDSPAKVQ
jgi:hypothetical protein